MRSSCPRLVCYGCKKSGHLHRNCHEKEINKISPEVTKEESISEERESGKLIRNEENEIEKENIFDAIEGTSVDSFFDSQEDINTRNCKRDVREMKDGEESDRSVTEKMMLVSESVEIVKQCNWALEVEMQEQDKEKESEEGKGKESEGNMVINNSDGIYLQNENKETQEADKREGNTILKEERGKEKEKNYVQILEESISQRERYLKELAGEFVNNRELKLKYYSFIKKVEEAEAQVRKSKKSVIEKKYASLQEKDKDRKIDIEDVCYVCGKEATHRTVYCPSVTCTKCKQKGHMYKVCFDARVRRKMYSIFSKDAEISDIYNNLVLKEQEYVNK